MQFLRLRLAGFKSFVDATELEIAPGMTGIVGPNGCGKSNLVEALRWVMGETSARRMRGGDMEDVIFGGTTTRPARNIAEVTLVIEDDGSLPVALTRQAGPGEVEILRRIERGEGSDYKVNGRSARARDVQTLFADAASGAHSPALVSQGRISALINAKPTERRQVLEEAAGIAGLHVRRHEAELKLGAAEANLTRLDDVLGTMDGQLAGLKKQARMAIRYRELGEDIRRADAVLLALRWQALGRRAEESRARFTAIDESVRQAMLAVAQATTRATETAATLPPLRREEAERIQAHIGVASRRDALLAEEKRVAAAAAEAERQSRQLDSDRAHEARLADEAVAVAARLAGEADTLVRQAESHPAALQAAEAELAAARTAVAEIDAELAELTSVVAAAQAEAGALARQKSELQQRLATLDRRLADERRRMESLPPDALDQQAIAKAETAQGEAERAAAAVRTQLAAAEAARADADAAVAKARQAERQASAESTRLAAEQKALANLLKAGASGNHPPVLDSVRVAPGYETALASALADGLEASLDDSAPRYWRPATDWPEAVALPAGCERLAPHITAPPPLGRALAHVGLVASEADGDRLAGSLAPGQTLVTRTGAAWRWDGLVRRPTAISPAAIRLEQRNRLEQIEAELASAVQAAKQASEALTAADRTLVGATAADKAARNAVIAATAALERARSELAQRRRDAESRTQTRQVLQRSIEAAETDRSSVAEALADAEAALAALPNPQESRARLDGVRTRQGAARSRLAAAQSAVERLGREQSARNARLAAIAAERQEWAARADRTADRLAEFDRRRAELAETRERLAGEPARLAAARDEILSELAGAEYARSKAADKVAAAEAAQQAAERALRQAEASLAEARENRVRAEAAVAAVLEEIEQLRDRAVERLGNIAPNRIDLPLLAGLAKLTPETLPSEELADSRYSRLIRDRELLGPVNLRAEIEVAEMEAEIARMTTEKEDLLAAIARLRQAVHGLNREARERLLASFGTIDAHFRRLFTQLFGGGTAELALTEADDPLQAGLEIMASPPGKRLQSLTLLSGGEQALTAIALIFAMFLTNPSPVCVLDEVDAPLDDANVDRFCSLVQEIAEEVGTRFMIITHHRLTMARMDRLYGVTMGERGVSQLVSVDLRQADEIAAA